MVITFGSAARNKNAVGFKNTTSNNVMVHLLRETIAPGTTKYVSFSLLDDSLTSQNLRNNSLYSVNSLGNQYKSNDVEELCGLISAGSLQVYTATLNFSTNTTSNAATAAYSVYTDGSVSFS
jgi:hypothetical protein